MNKKNRNKLLLMLAVIVLVLLSCSEVYVLNELVLKVRVMVTMPGESVPETALLTPQDSDAFFSDYEGAYTVRVMLDEEYRATLQNSRESMQILLAVGLGELTPAKISECIKEIERIDKLLENKDALSCGGETVEGEAVDVIISNDPNTKKIIR